jgi:membrane fusion protein, macrolide-specific efflux system
MTERTTRPWLNYLLGAACVGAIVAAFLVVGPASGSQSTVTRTAIAAQGVVQSTVSGSGNLQAASQLDLGFKTGGTVTNIYVTQGQHVTEGQLLATLNPESAEVTLEQSKAALQSAEAALAKEEETDGETSAGGTSSDGAGNSDAGSGGASASAAAAGSVPGAIDPETATVADVSDTTPAQTSPADQPATPGTSTTPNTTSPTPAANTPAATPTSTTPAATTPTPTGKSPSKKTTAAAPTSTTTADGRTTSGSERGTKETKEAKSSSSSSTSTISTATREANLASARAAVKSDKLTVQSDEEAVQNTKLYAPEDGTIVSLSGQVGETVSGGGTTKSSSGSSSSAGASGTGAAATGGASAAGAGAGSSSSSSKSSDSSSSSSSSFAILSDLSSMQLVVALSESEIGNVKAGQPATVTVEALNGAKLAAHVSEVALLSTSSSGGAVSYDVTFQLDQLEAGLKVGMSATAEVVVKQAEGVNVPTSAISADSVTVKRDGKEVRQRVVTGLAGNTSTIVLSGLKAGETVVLPTASTTGSSATNLLSKLGSRAGGGGLGGGGIGGGAGIGGGGGAFFRGGG